MDLKQTQNRISLIKLDQGSEQYFEKRKQFVFTASNIPNIFGYGYETRQTYFKRLSQKTELPANRFVDEMREEGNRCESLAADLFENLSGIRLIKTGLWPHATLPWLAASPDRGVDTNAFVTSLKLQCNPKFGLPSACEGPFDTIMEIKTRTKGYAPFKPGDDGFIKFWLQMQTQMQCTGARYCIYYGYSDFCDVGHEIWVVERDDEQWFGVMLPEIRHFKGCLDHGSEITFKRNKTKFTIKAISFVEWLSLNKKHG